MKIDVGKGEGGGVNKKRTTKRAKLEKEIFFLVKNSTPDVYACFFRYKR